MTEFTEFSPCYKEDELRLISLQMALDMIRDTFVGNDRKELELFATADEIFTFVKDGTFPKKVERK